MIDRKRRYNIQAETPYPHVGMFLKKYIKDNNISRAALAKKMDVSYPTLCDYFKQQSLQIGILWKMSLALKYNFVAEIAEQLPIAFVTQADQEFTEQLAAKEKIIEILELELAVYLKVLGK